MKISELITDKYKLRIPPTVYYELLADVQEVEEEQEPTTKNDLGVDREDAVERLNAIKQLIGYDKDSEIVKVTQKSLDMAIKALEQEPRKGHWIEHTDNYGFWEECSVCGTERAYPTDYCPDCGADMRADRSEEE